MAQQKQQKDTSYLMVAAIDFGTAYSGYAFSMRNDFIQDPLKVVANIWQGDSLMSQKAPTCVLFTPDKKFKAFGFEAEDEYAKLAADKEHKRYYYFRRFKMRLFNQTHLKRKFMLEDEMGNKMPAMDVFSACIKVLRENLLTHCRKQVTSIKESEIGWVLTIPAIWNDTSKQFMREAAEKAGIKNEQLLMALEPEAASICCRHLKLDTIDGCGSGFVPFAPKSKYLVFDAGGGTVDITVHEVQENNTVKELYAANGGSWGGTYIDKAFHNMLSDIIGNEKMDDFQATKMDDYISLFRSFEVKKRSFKAEMTEKVRMTIPIALTELSTKEKIDAKINAKREYRGRVVWDKDKLAMEAGVANDLFKDAFDNVVSHLTELFQKDLVKDVTTILMVGGFSESPMLQSLIKKTFPKKKVIIPQDPGLAVLKGAVIFGHDPTVVEERRCRYTYGVQTSFPFEEGKHPESKKILDGDGKAFCSGMFSKHVEVGQPVVYGEAQVEKAYAPTKPNQNAIVFQVFTSTEKDPVYVSDPSCKLLGSIEIALEGTGMDRSATVQMIFSDTELHVTATETKTGKKTTAKLNFLG